MSTLAAAATSPATQPANQAGFEGVAFWVVVGLLALAGWIVSAVRFGILRPKNVAGPERMAPPLKVWPLWIGVGAAIISTVIASSIMLIVLHPEMMQRSTDAPASSSEEIAARLTEKDLAVSATVPSIICFAAVAGMLFVIQPGTLRGMGLSLPSLGGGVAIGILCTLVIVPSTFLSGLVTEIIYQWVGFKHPNEHDLLRVMKSPEGWVKWAAIAGAVIVAPVWEEFVFRGLFQTALTEGLMRLRRPATPLPPPMPPLPAPMPMPAPVGSIPPPAAIEPQFAPIPPPLPPPWIEMPVPQERRYLFAWASILITSALFAMVHPMWTWPEIFLLAIALGYIYERTGKLWVSMTVHALFNMVSTLIYLSQ